MVDVIDFPSGGYRFIKGVFPYSAGVAALPGYRIERVRFPEPLALPQAFTRIADVLGRAGRAATAFCACELRSPAPFTEDGFAAFNRGYVAVLKEWGLFAAGANPVARANVCPALRAASSSPAAARCRKATRATATTSWRAAMPARRACAPRQPG